MSVQETPQQLWGGETRKAVDNFPVSGERVPPSVIHWLGRIKGAAARANVELGYLVGAVRRGARTDTGVHYESERRMEQELAGVPTHTREFRLGLAAGGRSG